MRIDLPDTGNPLVRSAMDVIRRAFISVVSTQEAVPFVLLQATDRSVWKVTVSTSGALTTTKVQG